MSFRPPPRPSQHPDGPRPPRALQRQEDGALSHGNDPLDEPLPEHTDNSFDDGLEAPEAEPNEGFPDTESAEDPDPTAQAEEGDEPAQRFAEDSVKEGMATAAVHPQTHVGADSGQVRPATGAAALAPEGWSQLSDAEIMLRVAAGDEAGFSLLVEKYRRQMVHYMYRMVHNQAVAEEMAQEVFLRVYRARASYRAEAKFSTWLYRIATNLGVNHARDTRHERGTQAVYLDQPDPETGISPDVADSTPTVEQNMLQEARFAAIRKHVMALPERQRTAVLMHKYQDLDYKQIGAVLKLSESATKSLLFRAYQTLRERLKEFV
jgi:RNA polymerase sigma-70 factor (ECF subfamily)